MHAPTGRIAAFALALTLSACAGYRPIIDQQSILDTAQYERDLSDCQRYAEEIDPGVTALIGAAGGALIGAAIGAIADDPWWGIIAAAGALGGAVSGAQSGAGDQKDIIRNCMGQRGYSVLN